MDYELALKLKNAGFPLRKNCSCDNDNCVHLNEPTLEELTEACPKETKDGRFTLQTDGDKWVAGYQRGEYIFTFESGSTPTEAVARLWLAIRKK